MQNRQRLLEQLKKYRDRLADYSRSNKELYYKEGKSTSLNLTKNPFSLGNEEAHKEENKLRESFVPLKISNSTAETVVEEGKYNLTEHFGLQILPRPELFKRLDKIRSSDEKFQREYGMSGAWLLGPFLCWRSGNQFDEKDLLISPILKIPVNLHVEHKTKWSLQIEDDSLSVNNGLALALREYWGIDVAQQEDATSQSVVQGLIKQLEESGKSCVTLSAKDTLPKVLANKVRIKDPETGEIIEERESSLELDLSIEDQELYKMVKSNQFVIIDILYVDHLNASRMAFYNDYERLMAGDLGHGPLSELMLGVDNNKPSTVPNISAADLDNYKESTNLFAVDIDSSQHRAIATAKAMSTFVIQGPPGTGKSQTITNLIGEHLKNKQRVLFVSEKRPALDVVFDRLSRSNLGENAVVIHGSDLNKKALYQSFSDSFETPGACSTRLNEWNKICGDLDELKKELGGYRETLKKVHEPSGLSISDLFTYYSEVTSIKVSPELTKKLILMSYEQLSKVRERLDIIQEHIAKIPNYSSHSWLYRKAEVIYSEALLQKYITVGGELDEIKRNFNEVLTQASDLVEGTQLEKIESVGYRQELNDLNSFKTFLSVICGLHNTFRSLTENYDGLLPASGSLLAILAKLENRPALNILDSKSSSTWTLFKSCDDVQAFGVKFKGHIESLLSNRKYALEFDPNVSIEELKDIYEYFKVSHGIFAWFDSEYRSKRRLAKSLLKNPRSKIDIKQIRSAISFKMAYKDMSELMGSALNAVPALSDILTSADSLKIDAEKIEHIAKLYELGVELKSFKNIDISDLSKCMHGFEKVLSSLREVKRGLEKLSLYNETQGASDVRNFKVFVSLKPQYSRIMEGLNLDEGLELCSQKLQSRIDKCKDIIALCERRDSLVHQMLGMEEKVSDDFSISMVRTESLENRIKLLAKTCLEIEDLQALTLIDENLTSLEALGLHSAKISVLKYFVDNSEVKSWSLYALANAVKYWHDEVMSKNRDLLRFDQQNYASYVTKFKKSEQQHQSLSQDVVNMSAGSMRVAYKDSVGHRLIAKQALNSRRFMSPRQLMEKGALDAMLNSKLCWLMNPLTISQILPFVKDLFDVVIFDEASQVRVEDAIPSIYRGKKLIIVGDNKQMPPTNFFSGSADDGDEDSETMPESLLDLAINVSHAELLQWHYRSQKECLIAFSNRAFYGGRLIAAPNPRSIADGSAITFNRVNQAYFTQKTGNLIEARAVIAALAKHLKAGGTQSVGIIAMGTSQVMALEQAREELSASDPEARELFERADNYTENGVNIGLFIKNLENVQGDERDIIFVSIGYGPASEGKVMHKRFGPISTKGGERRLNVAITRAKKQMQVFASFDPSAIGTDHEDVAKNPSTAIFGRWLKYVKAISEGSEENAKAILDSFGMAGEATQRKPTRFNLAVKKKLEERGFQVSTEVGSSGFFIDLAIHHPNIPNNFILGIECDGAVFHSTPYARERDKIRQKLLEDRGWHIERIWSQSWSKNWQAEVDRIVLRFADLLKAA